MKAITGRVIIKMDTTQKERYSFDNGTTLYIEKGYEFNRRLDKPSMAEVIDGDGLPAGSEILVHHNATEPTYEIPYQNDFLPEQEIRDGYKIFSIPEDMVFCYKFEEEWIPCNHFLLTTRIFKPYKGKLIGIGNEQVKNRLYVTKGSIKCGGKEIDLSGLVCLVTENSDYQIIWHNKKNREESLIRTREREILGEDIQMLRDLKRGKYIIGLSPSTAAPLGKQRNEKSKPGGMLEFKGITIL